MSDPAVPSAALPVTATVPPRHVGILLVLLSAAYLALLVAVTVPARGLLLAAVVGIAALEVQLARVPASAGAAALLDAAGGGPELRLAVRATGLTAFAVRETSGAVGRGVVVTLVAVVALHVLRRGLRRLVAHLGTPPLLCRGLRLRHPGLPSAPSGWTTGPLPAGIGDLPLGVGLAVAGAGAVPVVLGCAACLGVAVVPVVLLATAAWRMHRRQVRTVLADAVRSAVSELAPQVVLYFAGGSASRYQMQMWLEPVERLGRPALGIVRDPSVLAGIGPTGLPLLCVPSNTAMLALRLPTVRAALYVSNAAGNIHLLRGRGMWSVFVGHGDSDKAASASPFTRVYDEIWVAGPAGRERYLRAGVDIAPERIVEVGRPQVPLSPPARRGAGARTTILYAPTWEGWGDEEFASSVPHLGARLVRALLERPDVAVVYRPHPLTGTRDPRARRASAQIVALLRAAGAGDGDGAGPSGPPGHRVVLPPAPPLATCWAATDGLVADVSSVVTDFLGADRPFAILDAAGLGAEEFRRRYPSADGGYVLGPDLAGLDEFLAAAGGGADPSAPDRRCARRRQLGAEGPDGDVRFRAAVERLLTTAHPTASAAAHAASHAAAHAAAHLTAHPVASACPEPGRSR